LIPAAHINFQGGVIQSIAPGGTLQLIGAVGVPNYIVLNTATAGVHWILDIALTGTVNMDFVTVNWSDATFNPILIPPNVLAGPTPPTPFQDLGWVNVMFVQTAVTLDTNHNGKIDRILVTVPAVTDDDFTGFVANVAGYTIDTSKGTNG